MFKVSVLFEYPSLNGGERSLLAIVDELRTTGIDVHAIAPPTGPLAHFLTAIDVPIAPLRFRDASDTKRPLAELRADLAQVLCDVRPALLHANSLSVARLSGPVATASGMPSIGHLRDIVHLSKAAVADLNCHRRLLAVSHATCEFHSAQGLAAEKAFVAYNGVDTERFRPRRPIGRLHDQLGLPPEAVLIGSVGQIALRKGFDIILTAMAAVMANCPDVHLVLVGQRHSNKAETRQLESDLHERSRQAPLAGRVHFLGTREDVDSLLPELTLLVHAARQEPLGRVLLEAAACGVPVVATDVGGAREIFGHKSPAAYLIPVDDPDSLATAITAALGDPKRRAHLAERALQRIHRLFDHRTAAHEVLKHYQAVLHG